MRDGRLASLAVTADSLGDFARTEAHGHFAEHAQLVDALCHRRVAADLHITDVLQQLLGEHNRNSDHRLSDRLGRRQALLDGGWHGGHRSTYDVGNNGQRSWSSGHFGADLRTSK